MQHSEVSSGFTDLLSEFKHRTRTPTDVEDLRLTFGTSSDFYVYTAEVGTDYLMMLATYNPRYCKWTYFLTSGRPARKLVEELCKEYGFKDVVNALNRRFKEYKKSRTY